MQALERQQDWEGTAAELADLASVYAHHLGLADEGVVPNERLVRNYTQIGILDRPERRGKEAHFGFRQVVQFLAARVLLRDGWPLPKIAQYMRGAENATLLGLIPGGASATRAQALVERFKRGGVPAFPLELHEESVDLFAATPAPDPVAERSAGALANRTALHGALAALGTPAEPERRLVLRIALAPWCQVLVDPDELKRRDAVELTLLGEALARALIDERNR